MMKRLYILIVMTILLVTPQLEAQKYGIKVVTGSFYGKRPADEWISTSDYYSIRTQPASKAGGGIDFSIEAFYYILPQFSLSLGFSYLEKSIDGNRGEFTYPDDSGYNGGFFYSPETNTTLFPVTLTGAFIHRLNDKMVLNVMGGGGYYFGNAKCLTDNFDRLLVNSDLPYAYLPEFFQADLRGIGFHFGLGADINLSDNTYFVIEALYKSVKFSDLKSKSVRDSVQSDPILAQYPSTMMILWRVTGDATGGNIVYKFNNLDYSGIQMRVGIKFRF